MKSPLLADIIPTPQELRFLPGAFRMSCAAAIRHPLGSSAADLRSAALLAEALASATGRRPRVIPTTRHVNHHLLHIGGGDDAALPHGFLPPEREGYAVRVDARGMLLAGADAAGLFYAVQTLRQALRLRRRGGVSVPAMSVRDRPAIRHRAVMVDIARQLERADYLEGYVRELASYKKNMFVLYFEDKFRWRKHAALGHPLGYTAAEFRRLAAVAAENHMEFVPALASLGHCENILRHKEIAHLREDGAIYQLSLRHPGTRKLLADLYAEILPLYQGRYFHVNCDESPLLAGPPGSPKSYLRESLRLFGAHLAFLHDLLARHGKEMMIWGDMLLHYPGIMEGLPRDIIVVDWDYGSFKNRTRQGPDFFREHGFPFMVAPAAGRSAEVSFPPIQQMEDNCPRFIRLGREKGAIGEMTCLWELDTTNSIVEWPGVISSAQYAWNPDAIEPEDVARRIAVHRHGPEAAADVVRAYHDLASDRFGDRYSHEARSPQGRKYRSYHLDSHELAVTDPMVHLTYRENAWADSIVRQAEAGVADVVAARKRARWGLAELDACRVAGLHQAYQGRKRAAVAACGRLVVEAERLRRKGDLQAAAAKLRLALKKLTGLDDSLKVLIPVVRKTWAISRHLEDPGFGTMFMHPLEAARRALPRHIARLEKVLKTMEKGRDVDLSAIVGGQPVLYLEADNPSTGLIDILRPIITVSDDGRSWRIINSKGWFMLTSQTYGTALAVARLPERIRIETIRTHINPKAYPTAGRYRIIPCRTLAPGEIIDGPPEADFDTLDWRVVRTPDIGYRLARREGMLLEFERIDAKRRAS